MTGGTYSASPARADGYLNIRGITPKKGPMPGGKGGIAWIEVTSTVNNPQLSPLAPKFLEYVQDPEVAHTVAFAEGTFNPVTQMGNPEVLRSLHAGRARSHPVGQPRRGDGGLRRVRHRARLRQAARPDDRRQARSFRRLMHHLRRRSATGGAAFRSSRDQCSFAMTIDPRPTSTLRGEAHSRSSAQENARNGRR